MKNNLPGKLTVFITLGIFYFLISPCFHVSAASDNEVNFMKAKVRLFQDALQEFGALSPEDAATIWAKGVKERNGAIQYATLDNRLKKVFEAEMEKESSCWVTGVSSPWVESYVIEKTEKETTSQYMVTVRFELATSAGKAGKCRAKLLVVKENKYWVIKNIQKDIL